MNPHSKFYFSGVADLKTRDILLKAKVTNYLADPVDFENLPRGDSYSLAMDSGAYRAFKKESVVDITEYKAILQSQNSPLDFAVAPDIIGDPHLSYERWDTLWNEGVQTMPVWTLDAPEQHLATYLERSVWVGIGALVSPMRAKDEETLKKVRTLCESHPGRFHLFGLNWLKAMGELKESAASMDTSKFLDAARYGHVIFVNSKTGKLSQCPAKTIPELSSLTRDERLILSASNLRRYFAGEAIESGFGIEALENA